VRQVPSLKPTKPVRIAPCLWGGGGEGCECNSRLADFHWVPGFNLSCSSHLVAVPFIFTVCTGSRLKSAPPNTCNLFRINFPLCLLTVQVRCNVVKTDLQDSSESKLQ
jgi:hypothetical protein